MAATAADRAVYRVPLSHASSRLGAIVDEMHNAKGYFVLERNGVPVAALVDIDEFEDFLELTDPDLSRAIAESRGQYVAGQSRPAEAFLAEIEEELRHESNDGET